MWPDPDARYRAAADLRVRFAPEGIEIWGAGCWIAAGPWTIPVLQAFAAPARAADVVDSLGARATSPSDLIALVTAVGRLLRGGALVHDGDGAALVGSRLTPGQLRDHRFLLGDHTRVERFVQAIRSVVRPGDVVIDVGCGTGVLSVAAVKAGASRVYALERSGMIEIARHVIADNAVADRVTVLQGDALDAALPELADVLVAELIGPDPWSEGLLDVLAGSKPRLLKPDGRVIPARVTMLAAPIEMPREALLYLGVTEREIARWEARYGIDLSAVARDESNFQTDALFESKTALSWAAAAPVRLAVIDTAGVTSPALHGEACVRIERDASINGLLVGFEAELSSGITISSIADDTSWDLSVRAVPEPVYVREGSTMTISYERAVTTRRVNVAAAVC